MTQSQMQVLYHLEPIPTDRTLPFLALLGPTWCPPGEAHWHGAALSHLRHRKYRGSVALPMHRDDVWLGDEAAQVDWQCAMQERATTIVFWIPRIGPMTYLEFGRWHRSGKCILGVPPTNQKSGPLLHLARQWQIPVAITLEDTLDLALARSRR